jgi:hypothetical protein
MRIDSTKKLSWRRHQEQEDSWRNVMVFCDVKVFRIMDLLSETRDKLQASVGYASGPQRAQFDIFFNNLHKVIIISQSFDLLILQDAYRNKTVQAHY